MHLKQELYNKCVEFIDNRFKTIQNTITDIQKALFTETKSSAGDKHETGRAMLQLEREKAGNQLAEINKIKETLYKINIDKNPEIVSFGSIAYTSQGNYFLAISAGELKVANESFYAISSNTPVGKLLIGKKTGDEIIFRQKKIRIISVN